MKRQPVDLARPRAPGVAADRPLPAARGSRRTVAVALTATVVAAGVALRFWAPSELWLDEALSVNIAALPLRRLPEALRQDGAPPLYYVVLHFWMRLFGDGNAAVRSLSGVLSVAALPLAWAAGRRLGGRRTAVAALLLMSSSPFAVRYASETRMYSMVVLLTLLGYLALVRALEEPSLRRLVPVGLVSGALLLSHYWSMYLLAATGAALAYLAVVRRGGAERRCLAAMAAGSLMFAPWLPVLAFQLRYTGAPWAAAPPPSAVVDVIRHFAAAHTEAGAFLALLYPMLHLLAVFARPLDGPRVELQILRRGPAFGLLVGGLGTVVLGVATARALGGAFTARYASVALAPFLLLAAMGTVAFPAPRVRNAVLALTVGLGLMAGVDAGGQSRTQAPQAARVLARLASPGDVVAYCPDQLGPAVSRLLGGGGYEQLTYPEGAGPERVDWVDYARRNDEADPRHFARYLLNRAGPGRQIFVVWAPRYRTLQGDCERLITELSRSRSSIERLRMSPRAYEKMAVVQFLARL